MLRVTCWTADWFFGKSFQNCVNLFGLRKRTRLRIVKLATAIFSIAGRLIPRGNRYSQAIRMCHGLLHEKSKASSYFRRDCPGEPILIRH